MATLELARPSATSARLRSPIWTSTISRRSTTRADTITGIGCWSRSRRRSSTTCAPSMSSPATAAMNSSCSCPRPAMMQPTWFWKSSWPPSGATTRGRWPASLSIGAVTINGPRTTLDRLIQQADKLVYTAKQDGKNRIRHRRLHRGGTVGIELTPMPLSNDPSPHLPFAVFHPVARHAKGR
jgi:hypothetical protein